MIYLDHNATSPIDPRVFESMEPYLKTFYGNPSSTHRLGRASRTAIETAREQVAQLVNAEAAQVVFTGGGTEANNLALLGAFSDNSKHILYGATEHSSVVDPLKNLAQKNVEVEALAVDSDGRISLDQLNSQLKSNTCLISIMHANNETGVIQDIQSLRSGLNNDQAIFHVDAVQSAGKTQVDFARMGVQLMTLSSHKLYGPKGVGALICDKSVQLNPLMHGGGQEFSLRPGTENVAAIVGFGKAAELASLELEQRRQQLLSLQNQLEQQLRTIPDLSIVAERADRLANTTQVIIDGMDGEMMLMMMDRQGICISGGSACSSRVLKPSPVLIAMGYNASQSLSAIRISLGVQNTIDEVDRFCETLKGIVASYRS
jgi:cysteine desulfurase